MQNLSLHSHEAVGKHAYDSNHGLPPVIEFPEIQISKPLTAQPEGMTVGSVKYAEIRDQFEALTANTSHAFRPRLLGTRFAPLGYVEHCFQNYLRYTHVEWPVVHKSIWAEESRPWFLVLAAITCGASRETDEAGQKTFVAFGEFLRRALHCVNEAGEYRGSLALAQSSLLYTSATAQLPGKISAHRLPTAAANLKVAISTLGLPEEIDPSSSIDPQLHLGWKRWIASESHRRLLLFEWHLTLLFSSMSLNTAHRSEMPADDILLPSPSSSWNAECFELWRGSRPRRPRVWSALERLYTTHSVDPELDSTTQLLLVYAVIGRTQELSHQLQQPLRQWAPEPDDDSSSDEQTDGCLPRVGWLPANPEYAAWRNSACDSLDTLHWKANSEIAAAKGLERPIILHLHLARMILLCPYQALTQLAKDFGQSNDAQPFNTTPEGKRAFDQVVKWITLDDHKQRLSLVHAGAIFWHVRRYSKGSFSEPFAVFVSTLAIWFTGCFQPSLQASLLENKQRLAEQRRAASQNDSAAERNADGDPGGSSNAEDDEEPEDDTSPTSILLDRPCDDEIVQVFVRRGHNMDVLMSGAGRINTPYGMRRVLQEGIKMLRYAQYANNSRCAEYEAILAGITRRSHGERR